VPGRIVAGRWAGQTLIVEDDIAATGGYLLLIGPDSKGDGAADVWIEQGGLEATFDEAGWTVEWEPSPP
jgi:hypothetical protein